MLQLERMNPEENKTKPQERVPIKSLRTYQGDVQEAIEKNKYSSTTILVTEQKRKLESPVDPEKENQINKNRNKTFIILGVALIVIGLVSISTLYYIKSNEKINVEQRTKSIITFSEEKTIDIGTTNEIDFALKVKELSNSWNMAVNSVLYLNLLINGNEAGVENTLSLVAPNMPPSLVRSFGEKYMFGIYSFDTNEPFIILTVNDFSLAYPGMLKWEKDLVKDLGGMFGAVVSENASTSTPVFTDETVKNKDLRVARDSSGNPILLYSFIDRKTLIITKNQNILSALVDKMIINKQVR
ncbi:MAG: hypothetical protein AB198_02740 [Parcubacteria bacterium C7867-003]|nr:MAG: hypothetical protein AB198_02740 [Parcubacteria bacterium C7867-003]